MVYIRKTGGGQTRVVADSVRERYNDVDREETNWFTSRTMIDLCGIGDRNPETNQLTTRPNAACTVCDHSRTFGSDDKSIAVVSRVNGFLLRLLCSFVFRENRSYTILLRARHV